MVCQKKIVFEIIRDTYPAGAIFISMRELTGYIKQLLIRELKRGYRY